MITFNNIVTKFQEFCDNHFFIQTFSYGSPADVDLEKFEQYPLLHLVYTGGDYNSPKAKTYNLEVYILSVPPSEADKTQYQKESISNAEQVAEDILADIQNGGNIFQFGYDYELTSASVTPLEEEKSNALAGCLLDLSIVVPYTYDSCNAPLTGVEPEGSGYPSFKARGLLRVRELDGSPDVLSVATINVPNGSLTDDGEGEITLTFGGDAENAVRLVQTVKNVSGGLLEKGTPVHAVLDGASGNLAYVIKAKASDPTAMPATFVLNEDLADEAEGEAIITGLIQGVDTSAFTPGDVIYVGKNGGYTNVKPQSTDLIQNLGIVIKSHVSNGSGIVYGAGRSNDVPNLKPGGIFIGTATNTVQSDFTLPLNPTLDGRTLVFDASTEEYREGYPTSANQVSTWTTNSTSSTAITTTGIFYPTWGNILAGTLTIDQDLRAGWNMGWNSGATQILGAPLSLDSTISVSVTMDITAPVGAVGQMAIASTVGYYTAPTYTPATIVGDGTTQTYTVTSTAGSVSFWQLANSAQVQLLIVANPGTITVEPKSLTITVNHA